jgi:hypothetical protein
MARPPHPTYLTGVEWEAVPDASWRLVSGRRCRAGKPSCKQPSVAELRRSSMGDGRDWWAYCGEHLFGRWIEDGQVMHWVWVVTRDA